MARSRLRFEESFYSSLIAQGGEVAASMRNRKTPQNNCHSGGDINRLIKIFTVIPGHPIPRRLRQFAGMPQ